LKPKTLPFNNTYKASTAPIGNRKVP